MTQPTMKRLLESPGDEYAHAVLRSAEGDAPSRRAFERAALAVGMATGAAVTASTASASVGAGAAATAGTTTATTATAGVAAGAAIPGLAGLSLAKAVAVTIVAGALATSAVALRPTSPKPPATTRTSPSASAVTAPMPASPHSEPRVAESPVVFEPPPTPATPSPPPARAPLTPPSRTTSTVVKGAHAAPPPSADAVDVAAPVPSTAARAVDADLRAAMSILDSARASLEAHEPAKALALVSDYERQFPRGVFSPEATVLKIDALAASGARSEALVEANGFLASAPNSPHARHVRAVIASLESLPANAPANP